MIQFHLSDVGNSRAHTTTWNSLAARLEGVASVGAFDLGADHTVGDRGANGPQKGPRKDPVSLTVLEEYGLTLETLQLGPVIRYGAGQGSRDLGSAVQNTDCSVLSDLILYLKSH